MKAAVYGSWHLAEVYAMGLCDLGHEVRLIASEPVVSDYRNFKPPVLEPGIVERLQTYTKNGMISFSTDARDISNKAEVCFFAEDCTVTKQGVDMADIETKFRRVAGSGHFKIISVSSQLPIGTCRRWQKKYRNVRIVYYPEFLRLGDALKRFIEPDYIVLGGDEDATKHVFEFFSAVETPKFAVSLEEAEMSKHAANIFVAMTVSFLSELTKFSEHFNVNLEHIGKILRADKRVGPKAYTMPGMGFSGETLERDIRVLIQEAKRLRIKLPLFEQIIAVNDAHNLFIEREPRKRIKTMRGKKIGFIGATYKPFTSTLRGSLVAPLMKKLAKEGAIIALYDPLVEANPSIVATIDDAFSKADAVVITVGKKEFKDAPYKKLITSMRKKIIIDAANMFTKEDARKLDIDYSSIGRGHL